MISDITESKSKEKKSQKRRKHYRLNYLWEVCYKVVSDNCENEEKDLWFKGITTDISGGGCCFNSERQQKKDDILIIRISGFEKEKEEFIFRAKVITSLPLSNREKTYENRVAFLELSFLEQEKLIQWIFEEKRKMKWQERSLDDEKKYFNY